MKRVIAVEVDVFEWQEDYEIGVDKIDNAHRQLFRIVNRIINNFMDTDFDKHKTTCIEAIKYLKNYTINHFAEEEAYQLSIGYSGYRAHKRVHDNMRDVVIPALEHELTAKSYAKEALEHFAGVCAGWLAAHVLVEDQAITGKRRSKWNQNIDERNADNLDNIVRAYIKGLFRMNATLVSKNYAGHKLAKLFCVINRYAAADGTVYSTLTALEESMLETAVRKMVNVKAFELDAVMLPIVTEMVKSFSNEVVTAFLDNSITLTSTSVIQNSSFYSAYETAYPDYSMLWRTDSGFITFGIKKKEAGQ